MVEVRRLVLRRGRLLATMALFMGSSFALFAPDALAATPQIIPPPGLHCPLGIQNPHVSTHMEENHKIYVIAASGVSKGCSYVVSSLTLTTYLILGSLSGGEEIASASTTWYNTSAPGYMTTASVACATYGDGQYSVRVTGSVVYNGYSGPLQPETLNDYSVTGCP